MKNWNELARAAAPAIPKEQLERIVPVLEKLEAAFAPLEAGLPLETEPAPVFRPLPQEAQ